MRQRRRPFRPQVQALEDRRCPSGSTVVLPIADFLSQQGTTMIFAPPVRDQLGSTNSVYDPGTTPSDPNRLLLADYTGQAAQYLLQHGINLHTTVSGFVTETPVGGSGLMEVSVNLEATNALTWVANIAGINPNQPGAADAAPLELGYRAQDLVANPHVKPALSDVHFQINFREQAGAPLPDLAAAFNEGIAPPGFAPEVYNLQVWGTGTLDAGTTVGTPGQTAFVNTTQVADLVHSNLPGTLPDGALQEPINIVPVQPSPSFITSLNGTLFITDLSNGNDTIKVMPAADGGVTVSSNLGHSTFANVTAIMVSLGGGNNDVQIASLPGVTVNVVALDGNNHITIGDETETVVSVGGGNNHVTTGAASPTLIFVGGNGNNEISAGAGQNNVYVAGDGNNQISATGTGDFVEVLGNGNNRIADTGSNDLVTFGGDGNNAIDNDGAGSFTDILAATGHNRVHGPFGTGG
jgi:hypothetical protein